MTFSNLLKTALYSIRARKLRVFLTMFGIIIGISSVVVILSVGDGLSQEVNGIATETSSNKYTVSFEYENIDMNQGIIDVFTKNDIQEIEHLNGIEKANASTSIGGLFSFFTVSYFDKTSGISVKDYQNEPLNIIEGRDFRKNEEAAKRIILDEDTATTLFESPALAIGRAVLINNQNYEVIGVCSSTGNATASLLGLTYSYLSEENIENMSQIDEIYSLDYYLMPGEDSEAVFENVESILEANHPEVQGSYVLEDPQAITKSFQTIIGGLTAFVACVSGISLFVGGVGVMNIMYVSVSERKREIGIRRAIGATSQTILLQFMIEAIIITGIGGLLGIFNGFVLSKIVGVFLPFSTVITPINFIGASVISVLVGLIFGIVPAINASKMDPIKAIYQ